MQFVAEHKDEHGVEPIIAALDGTCAQIAPSTYYAARSRPPSARAVRDVATTARIRRAHAKNYHVYGARKVWKDLARERDSRLQAATTLGPSVDAAAVVALPDPVVVPPTVARCTVERLMRADGLRGACKAKGPRTTKPAPETDRPGDKVHRDFTAPAPNRLWVADITYIRTCSGWVYAAFVMDMFSRRVTGWQVSTSLHTNLAYDALEMGLWQQDRAGRDVTGLTHHSDRGVQYRAIRYTDRLEEVEAVASVGTKGDSYDNAAAEALNSTFKAELIRNRHILATKGPWKSINDVEIAVAEWVEWYNTSRLHGSIGDMPPAEYEQAYYAEHSFADLVGATP